MGGKYLLLMAGKGSRFSRFSENIPKPILKIGKKKMFELAATSIINNFYNVKKIYLCCNKEVYDSFKTSNKIFEKINIFNSASPVETILKSIKISKIKNSSPLIVFDCDQIFNFDEKLNIDNIFSNEVNSFMFFKKTKNKSFGKIIINKKNYLIKSYDRNINLTNGIVGVYGFKKISLFLKISKILKNQKLKKEIVMPDIMSALIQYNKLLNKKTICFKVKTHTSFGTPQSYTKAIKGIS